MVEQQGLDERKASILRAIVSHYVNAGEPVGSKTLVERFKLGISPATVRNEMGALEEAGYIYQPHTSAGRIPTDVGYRYFVDAWAKDSNLGARDSQRIQHFFGEPRLELEDSLRQTATLLSSLTNHAAVVFAPALERSTVRRIELVRLAGERVMLLVVADTGRVENHVILLPGNVDDVQLDRAMEMLNRIIDGTIMERAAATIAAAVERFPLELRDLATRVAGALEDDIATEESERVFLEGTSTMVDEEKFSDLETVREVIGALEHRRVVLEVLADALSANTVSIRIGAENSVAGMQHCAVITSPYGLEGEPLGSLGVVGPTRMDYRQTIAAVHEVASALGRMLGDLGL